MIENIDGKRPTETTLAPMLISLGFHKDRDQTLRYDGYV